MKDPALTPDMLDTLWLDTIPDAEASYPMGALIAVAAITWVSMVLFPVWMIVLVITAGKQAAT